MSNPSTECPPASPWTRFWLALERQIGLRAVESRWRRLMGDDYDRARGWFMPESGLARSDDDDARRRVRLRLRLEAMTAVTADDRRAGWRFAQAGAAVRAIAGEEVASLTHRISQEASIRGYHARLPFDQPPVLAPRWTTLTL